MKFPCAIALTISNLSAVTLYSDLLESHSEWTNWDTNARPDNFFGPDNATLGSNNLPAVQNFPIAGLSPTIGDHLLHANSFFDFGTSEHIFTLAAANDVTFSLDIGSFNNAPLPAGFAVDILQAGSVITTLTGTNPTTGNFTTFTADLASVSAGNYTARITVLQETIQSQQGNIAFDNFVVETVPEPSSAALLLLGNLAFISRRKRS